MSRQSGTFTGPRKGTREITLNGTGTTNSDFDRGSFGPTGSYGWYHNESLLFSLRQTVNWAGARDEEDDVSGSTRVAADWHLNGGTSSRWRPFIGANFGYVYGDGVDETWSIGPELGVKYFVNDTTFILAQTEYQILRQR